MDAKQLVKKYRERANLSPEQMRKAIEYSIESEYEKWYNVYGNGSSDSSCPDGVSLELIKTHIISHRRALEKICSNDLPDIYYRPLPPDFPHGYMVVGTKFFDERIKNMHGWNIVFSRADEELPLF